MRKTILLAMFLMFFSTGTAFAGPEKRSQPNFVFFILDDMQRWMFNSLPEGKGKNLTPNIDRLANEGVMLTGMHVSAPVCTPSRYSCLTGRYASRALKASPGKQVVMGWNSHIMPDDVTLPKLLQRAGYTTGMVGKNHVISAPMPKGIPANGNPEDSAIKKKLQELKPKYEAAIRAAGFDYAASIYPQNPDYWKPRSLCVHNLDYIAKGAIDFIEKHDKDRPFYLYFASTVPHGPNQPSRSWKADPRVTPWGMLDEPPNVLPARSTIPARLARADLLKSRLQENVLWLDDAIGAVIQALEKKGVLDNTIIFFFNDHGQSAKGTLYEGGLSNPTIVWRAGGFPCGKVSETLLSNIDFAPTILDMAGVLAPKNEFDGRSFKKVLLGEKGPVHESIFAELGYARAVIKGNFKYLALRYPPEVVNMPLEERKKRLESLIARLKSRGIRPITTDPKAGFSHITAVPGGGHAEAVSTGKRPAYYDADQLYDLSKDPKEDKNLAKDPKYAEKLAEMKAELKKHLADLPGTFAELKK